MQSLIPCLGMLLLLAECSPTWAADTSLTTEHEVAALIPRLGHERYSEREAASKRLIELDIAAKRQLQDVVANGAIELRQRAERALLVIEQREARPQRDPEVQDLKWEARLSGLSKKRVSQFIFGDNTLWLPGWNGYRKLVRDTYRARALFIEMQFAAPELLEAYEQDPKEASRMLEACSQAFANSLSRNRVHLFSQGWYTSLLLVAGDPRTKLTPQTNQLLLQHLKFRTCLSALNNQQHKTLRKLFCAWLGNPTNTLETNEKLKLVLRLDLKQGLPLAIPALDRPESTLLALRIIRRFGDETHVPLVEPLLADTTLIKTQEPSIEVPICDCALATLVHLSGQPRADYGLKHETLDPVSLAKKGTYFENSFERDRAFDKWRAWSESNISTPQDETPPPPNFKRPAPAELY